MSAIRPEVAGDVTAIRRVHVEAFGRRDEADMVDALRLAGALRVALVAVKDGAVVGRRLQPGGDSGRCERHQRHGFGANGSAAGVAAPGGWFASRACGSDCLPATLYSLVFVLGAPQFYGRFGFTPAKPMGFAWEYGGPPDAFMVQALRRDTLFGSRGVVAYRAEFVGL